MIKHILTLDKKKDDSTSSLTNNLTGFTYLCDTSGIREANNSGIVVSIEGTSISTTTGTDGKWNISNLKTGTYTFIFAKPNFGAFKIVEKNVIQGYQLIDTVSLYPIPLYTVKLLSDSISLGGVYIYGVFSGTLPSMPWFRLFFSKNSNVSSNPANYIYEMLVSVAGAKLLATFELAFSASILNKNGFISGDSIYIIAYTDLIIPDHGSISYAYIQVSNATIQFIFFNLKIITFFLRATCH